MLKSKSICCEIIKTCPLSCKHCSTNASASDFRQMSISDYEKLLTQAVFDGVDTMFISGGEPLLHKDILHFVELTSVYNLKSIIYTSGIISNHSDVISLSKESISELYQNGLNGLTFSIYGQEQKHDFMTNKKGSFNLLLETLQNSKDVSVEKEFSFLPLKHNFNDIGYVVKLAKKYNIKKINILKLITQGRAKNSGFVNLSKEEESIFFKQLSRYTNKIKIEVSKLYDCDHYDGLLYSPYYAGVNEEFFTFDSKSLPGRSYRNLIDEK